MPRCTDHHKWTVVQEDGHFYWVCKECGDTRPVMANKDEVYERLDLVLA